MVTQKNEVRGIEGDDPNSFSLRAKSFVIVGTVVNVALSKLRASHIEIRVEHGSVRLHALELLKNSHFGAQQNFVRIGRSVGKVVGIGQIDEAGMANATLCNAPGKLCKGNAHVSFATPVRLSYSQPGRGVVCAVAPGLNLLSHDCIPQRTVRNESSNGTIDRKSMLQSSCQTSCCPWRSAHILVHWQESCRRRSCSQPRNHHP